MDIPNTGAIFTLGKSYLAESSQSYFYIKNDPIKKLIAGPYQSAVICESGRLFVWGENHYGQLGIGGHSSITNKQNNNTTSNGDIIIKPTCVKSLKALGLKVADIAFGHEWSVVLTYSNELFFTGRNVFSSASTVSSNFMEATVNEDSCEIIRKPFRLEEFDDCLSNNEETENFVNVLAGNEHFVVLTSFGRLIGWGSNQSHQLGSPDEPLLKPHEIVLDSPVQQFACGPESTLVLTEKGKLYLTGQLNDFVFPQFTELQKNLSPTEQIIFMHISHASEVFIVTNTGGIYRSLESLRNKSLIFQRFYDYDSEENGPIWKLLKGTSFYAILTKANKLYTTFSESGHHLKTFREISKFKNLRVLDMALGDRHVLVHGIPRSSTLAATMGPGAEHRFMSQSMRMSNTTGGLMGRMKNGLKTAEDITLESQSQERPKTNTPVHETLIEEEETSDGEQDANKDTNNNLGGDSKKTITTAEISSVNHNDNSHDMDTTTNDRKSPTESLKSRKSICSLKKLNHMNSSEKLLRPRTPYPESSGGSSPQSVVKKSPMRNTSYETAMKEDLIEHTSPRLVGSLENIPESFAIQSEKPGVTVSMPTPPTEDDEELTVEIRETTDPLDHTVTINEIRFINNGIDVTANVKKTLGSQESLDEESDDDSKSKSSVKKQAEDFIEELEEEIDDKLEKAKASKTAAEESVKEKADTLGNKVESKLGEAKESVESAAKDAGQSIESKLSGAKGSIESAALKAATGAKGAVETVSDNAKKAAKGAKQTMENVGNSAAKATDNALQAIENMGNNAAKGAGDAKDAMGNAIRKMADDTRNAVGAVTSKISNEVQDAKNSLSSLLHGKKNKVDIEVAPDPHELAEVAEEVPAENNFKNSRVAKTTPTIQYVSTPGSSGGVGGQEDDERTTASVNSAHTSAGNPFESNNPFEDTNTPFDPELNAMIERSKKAFQEDVEAASMAAERRSTNIVESTTVEEKSKFSKFIDDMREKSKSLSCRNEKAVKIIEDQPPRYTVEDELALQPVNVRPENGSKVCTIL